MVKSSRERPRTSCPLPSRTTTSTVTSSTCDEKVGVRFSWAAARAAMTVTTTGRPRRRKSGIGAGRCGRAARGADRPGEPHGSPPGAVRGGEPSTHGGIAPHPAAAEAKARTDLRPLLGPRRTLSGPTRDLGHGFEAPAQGHGQGEAIEQEVALLVGAQDLVEGQEPRVGVQARAAQGLSEETLHEGPDRVGAEAERLEGDVVEAGLGQGHPEPGGQRGLAFRAQEAQLRPQGDVAPVRDGVPPRSARCPHEGHPFEIELHAVGGRVGDAQQGAVPACALAGR